MCGIAGVLRTHPGEAPLPAGTGEILRRSLAARGSDGEGEHAGADGRLLLVHSRLAVLDPSAASAQPMSTADGRFVLVYNGEVYNFRELGRSLEAAGEVLRTRGDTEVVLRLLAREGPAALSRLRGMFALALWDDREGTLLLARDRFGMKPLYIAADAGGVSFASTIGALRDAGLAGDGLSPAAVLAFLRWGSVPPPLAGIEGVEALGPGTWSRWRSDGSRETGRFADVRTAFEGPGHGSEADLRERVAAALGEGVRAHLVSDVPVGVFLSGGLDSSALVAAAAPAASGPLRTFTVAFEEAAWDEGPHARAVAERFSTDHTVIPVRAGDLARELPSILGSMDQPTVDGVNSWFVARAVARAGVRVVLSGTGGDELFGGYPSFRRIPRALEWGRRAPRIVRTAGRAASAVLPPRRRAKWDHWRRNAGSAAETFRAQRGLFMPEEVEGLLGEALRDEGVLRSAEEAVRAAEEGILAPAGEETPHAAVARMETRMYLGSQLLRDTDALSMAHSVEVRLPFVDQELLAAVWPGLGGHPALLEGKRLLRESLGADLPESVWNRPKQGFSFPMGPWLRGDLREFARESRRTACGAGLLDPAAVEEEERRFEKGRVHWSRSWALAVLGAFCGRGGG